MASQVIVLKMYCLESVVCGLHIYKDPHGERKTILVDIEKDMNGSRPTPNYTVGLQLLEVNLFSTTLFYHDWVAIT